MNKLALVLCGTIFLASPSFAQSPDAAAPPVNQGAGPAPDSGGGGGAGGGAGGGGGGGGKMKEIMQACRETAKGQGLKGHDLRQAVMDCAVKQKPQAAGRLKCRMEGKDKGLKKDELKTYVQSCMKGAG